jgi:hypothetical protein
MPIRLLSRSHVNEDSQGILTATMSQSDRLAEQEGSQSFIETTLHGGGQKLSTGTKG